MGPGRQIIRFAFDSPINSVSDPIQLPNGIAIFNIIGEKESGYKSFDNVKESIKRSMMRDKKKAYAVNILKSTNTENDWNSVANSNELINYIEEQEGIINSSFESIGTSDQLKGTLLGLNPGNTSKIIETFNTACKVRLIKKNEIDIEDFNNSFDQLKNQLITRKTNSNYTNWLNDMKSSINIEDYRSKSY